MPSNATSDRPGNYRGQYNNSNDNAGPYSGSFEESGLRFRGPALLLGPACFRPSQARTQELSPGESRMAHTEARARWMNKALEHYLREGMCARHFQARLRNRLLFLRFESNVTFERPSVGCGYARHRRWLPNKQNSISKELEKRACHRYCGNLRYSI